MENKKGNGLFLGIVSVATLIVAIMGATFAFFSATTNSDINSVNLGAYEFNLSLSVNPVWNIEGGLIPLLPNETIENAPEQYNTNLLYALNVGGDTDKESPDNPLKKCIDDQGLQVCALYEVTIENTATNDVTLTGQIKTTSNNPGTKETSTPFQNLTYQEITGNERDGFTVVPSGIRLTLPLTAEEEPISIASITVPGTDNPEEPGSATTYVLIYLNDTGSDQSGEMGATYEGQLIYTSTGGTGNNLTGRFTVSGTTGEDEGE